MERIKYLLGEIFEIWAPIHQQGSIQHTRNVEGRPIRSIAPTKQFTLYALKSCPHTFFPEHFVCERHEVALTKDREVREAVEYIADGQQLLSTIWWDVVVIA